MNTININKCPICCFDAIREDRSEKDTHKVNCTKCGKYEITGTALIKFERDDCQTKVQALSYWIKHHQLPQDGYTYLDLELMRSLIVPFVQPQPNEQAYNLIVWLGEKLKKPSDLITIQIEEAESIIGTTGYDGVLYIVDHLRSCGYLNDMATMGPLNIGLTFSGWNYYYELQHSNKNSRLAFMAMSFGNQDLSRIFITVIKPALIQTGFEIRRLDEEKRAGLIDDKLRVEIRRSRFLIADLTDDNNGAYWEAGFAEGLGMPVIYICEKKKFDDKTKTTHFDTNHHLTVPWEDTEEGLKIFADELKSTIRATLPTEAKMDD